MWAIGEPSGPIENGMTYIVRPRIAPRVQVVELAAHLAGSRQLFVGPASASRSEQMNVRSSTLATSAGSEWAQKLFGRFSASRAVNVPAATRSAQSWPYSSADPSHQWTTSGCRIAAQSSTHSEKLLVAGVTAHQSVSVVRCCPSLASNRGGWKPRPASASGRLHVDLGAETDRRRPAGIVEIEDDPLALAQHPQHRPVEGRRLPARNRSCRCRT